MINELLLVVKPIFEDMGLNDYLSISKSEKADFQINSVFSIAKDKKVNPIEIGEDIVKRINEIYNFEAYFKSVVFVKPGFINICVSDKFINRFINKYIKEGFIEKTDSNELYFLDYGGPNIAKPLHIGHLRPAIIGESFKRILNVKGYKTISDVHFGDYGFQIGEVIYGIKNEAKTLDDITLDYLNYLYPHMSALVKEDENLYNECKKTTFELQNGDYLDIFNKIKEVSISDIKSIYNYFNIKFDIYEGESDCKEYIPKLIKSLKEKDLLLIDEGDSIVKVKKETDNKEMPPLRVIFKDKTVGYATTDLATILKRVDLYKPDHIYYFADLRQSLHFESVFRTIKLLGIAVDLQHFGFGTINDSDGKPFKTRSGETIKLSDVINMTKDNFLSKREENKNMSEEDLDKQVNAIIKYADLQNNREKNYNFDISKFSEVSGKTGPYILYSAIRIRKILEQNEIVNEKVSDLIYNSIDRELRIKMLEFNEALDKAISLALPSVIAEYVYDLCNIVNTFYQNINISKIIDINEKNDLLNVLKLSYDIIKECLTMLIIEIPSEM